MRLLPHKLLNIMKILRSKAEKNVGIMLLTIKKECTKLRASRTSVPYVPLVSTCLVTTWFTWSHVLPALSSYVPSVFTCFMCLYFLPDLRAFILLSVLNFWRVLCTFAFLYKMWKNPKPTAASRNKQERGRINRK